MIKKLFFCENCRVKIEDVGQIHYVEDNSDRGFCGESCILEFYRPYMETLEQEEETLRLELNLSQDEGQNDILANEHYLQLILENPTEIWQVENELEQKYYTHVLEINLDGHTYFMIIICSYIDGSPSFVFYRTITGSVELVNKYRRDHQVELKEYEEEVLSVDEKQIEVDPDFLDAIELKKSTLLAQMLSSRSDDDLSLESFMNYDEFMEKTINDPDEIYEYEDDEGDVLQTSIGSFKKDDISFFYIVISMYYDAKGSKVVIPILGFPSTDRDLYPQYATGKKINETLKN